MRLRRGARRRAPKIWPPRRREGGDGGAEEAASGEITSRRGGGGGGWRGSQSREEGPRAQAVVAARARELKERASPRPAWWRHREGRYLLATLKPKEVVPDDSPPAVARSAKPTALLAPAFSHQDANDAAAAAGGGASGREGALIATPPPSELRSRSFSPGWRMGTAPGVDAFVNHPQLRASVACAMALISRRWKKQRQDEEEAEEE